jgi:hypothetical protein
MPGASSKWATYAGQHAQARRPHDVVGVATKCADIAIFQGGCNASQDHGMSKRWVPCQGDSTNLDFFLHKMR